MGQSLYSVMSREEINVLCMLANGARLTEDDVAEVLGCDEGDVRERMNRLMLLTGFSFVVPLEWGHA